MQDQTWPMPGSAGAATVETLRDTARPHQGDRLSHLSDWAAWVGSAPATVLEEHLERGFLDASLRGLRLGANVAGWTDAQWTRLWVEGGHRAWGQMCRHVRTEDSGAALAALGEALVAADPVDAVHAVLWRMRHWDVAWSRSVIVRRMESRSGLILTLGQQHGVRIHSAAASATDARIYADRRCRPLAAETQRLVGVPVEIALIPV